MMDGGHHYETCLARSAECKPDCTLVDPACRRQIPDLLGLDQVYPRIRTRRITHPSELASAIGDAFRDDGAVLMDVWIDKSEDVLPMVKPGQGLSEMIE
jgi:acetolactate synthase-1/2/3 large subunit